MWAKAAKRPIEAWYKMYVKPWLPELARVELLVLRVNENSLLTGTSTRSSETGWSLQPLKSLYMFTQTAKWWQLQSVLANLGCLLGLCIT